MSQEWVFVAAAWLVSGLVLGGQIIFAWRKRTLQKAKEGHRAGPETPPVRES